ncbi:FAD/NAD(P)-dependent oxidoreductase [Jatrophihabitans sp. YIM 134969]
MTSPSEPLTLAAAVTVVGAGPAGLAAAVAAADAGATVAVVDAAPRVGGQYWRHGPDGLRVDADLHHDVEVFERLEQAFARHVVSGTIRHLARHQVWHLVVDDDRCTVHAVDSSDPLSRRERTVVSDRLVIAVGAFDRQVPFPGWDLPGVLTVGGAQSLLKGSGVAVGPRVLVAGTGPFLLPVATGLAARGARVVGVHEANHPAGWLRHLPAVASQIPKIREAAGYAATLARHRVPVHHRSVVLAAHGADRVQAVTVARVDRSGQVVDRTRRRIEVDVLAVGHGFTVQAELPRQAGCELRPTADGGVAVTTDGDQRTSVGRVFAAGETTGVGGAQLAVAEGTVAGTSAGRAAGALGRVDLSSARRDRDRLQRFATALHAVYPVPEVWLSQLTPATVVCRCEEVTVADVDAAIDLGARDTRTVKLLSRSGMGWCQGRECAFATDCLTARRTGAARDPAAGADRPVAVPVPLGLVASGDA